MNLRKLISGSVLAVFFGAGLLLSNPLVPAYTWAQDQSDTHSAVGTVKAVDEATKQVSIAHGPVKSLGWQGMTMSFTVMDAALLQKLKVGQKVQFEFMQHGNMFMIVSAK